MAVPQLSVQKYVVKTTASERPPDTPLKKHNPKYHHIRMLPYSFPASPFLSASSITI